MTGCCGEGTELCALGLWGCRAVVHRSRTFVPSHTDASFLYLNPRRHPAHWTNAYTPDHIPMHWKTFNPRPHTPQCTNTSNSHYTCTGPAPPNPSHPPCTGPPPPSLATTHAPVLRVFIVVTFIDIVFSERIPIKPSGLGHPKHCIHKSVEYCTHLLSLGVQGANTPPKGMQPGLHLPS